MGEMTGVFRGMNRIGMRQRNRQNRAWIAVILFACGAFAHPAFGDTKSKPTKVNNVTVQAFADHEAIIPGETVNLAVSLKMDRKWHVYWRSPGGTGLPTEITWIAPDGFKIGETQFPIPDTHYDKTLKETSYIHEGTAVFLTPITAPDTAKPGATARFEVEVNWLACKKNCIPGSSKVSLEIPIAPPGTLAKPAHTALFEDAREALPTPADKAKHIKLSGGIDQKTAQPGKTFNAILNIEIAPKHHMQSRNPIQKGLIPAMLFVAYTDGFEIGEVIYPKAHERTDKLLGKLSEYNGKITLKVPVEVDEDADKKPRRISGIFQYQICTDAGMCYPPEHVTFEIPVQMEGGPAPMASVIQAAASTDTKIKIPSTSTITSIPGVSTSQTPNTLQRLQAWFEGMGYFGVALMAFLGGMLLNLMPCVLPVISLKILSFVKQANEDRRRILLLGIAYCFGILVFFGLIGAIYWQTNKEFGWGQQFQRPVVVLVLAALVTAFALSLFGVFALFAPKTVCKLGEKAEGEGVSSAFFTGVLATVLGTACTAPLLSAAIGAASKFSPAQGAWIFVSVGAGMAFPFLILAANPGWLKFVPKPGPWMGTFEALMGFLLLGTVIWLLYPLLGQLGEFGLLMTMIFLLSVALAVWIKGKIQFGDPLGRKIRLNALMILIVALGWFIPFRWVTTIDTLVAAQIDRNELLAIGQKYQGHDCGAAKADVFPWHGKEHNTVPWIHYDRADALDLIQRGYTVFVDYTADWCVNCKVNLKSSINVADVRTLMKEYNVIPFEADYTLPVPTIKEDLKRFGRAGVPMYLVYSSGEPDKPQILPEILTPGIVLDALKKAGPSRIKNPPVSVAKKQIP